MKTKNVLSLTLIGLLMGFSLQAHIGPARQAPSSEAPSNQVNFRNGCDNPVTQIDQAINNVRARLTTGGDVWWDGTRGRYIVPKQPPGTPEVSSIFAAGVWIGGKDPGGNLKLAAQTYGRANGNFDFYPGPLFEGDSDYPGGPLYDPRRGSIQHDTCAQWDKFFVVTGEHIDQHIANWREAFANGETTLDSSTISEDILGWPARGNPFFQEIHHFQLPNTQQGLAPFWDQAPYDGIYNPTQGDYPIIEIRGCMYSEPTSVPDEIIFWIYNDTGNQHNASGSETKLQMEIQVQAFSFMTNDDINNMTFQRYKLINRSVERLDSTHFGMWVDPDLGCSDDDYVGCDVDRSLAYVYNSDEIDGAIDGSCNGGVETYGSEVPILGIDYFRGPIPQNPEDIFPEELGMTSFTYYNNANIGTPQEGTTGPQTAQEYYNYLSGRWKDGTPFTVGGDGYQTGGAITPYAFDSPPNEDGWSMCGENLAAGDRRMIQSSGPFTLLPGAVNELIVGVIWVPDQIYPCPSLIRLQKADDLAQNLFDNCFPAMLGPDAPDVEWVELDREIVALFSNNELTSNNAHENFKVLGLSIPMEEDDNLFRFEGYKLYQLAGPNVSLRDKDDPEKVRLIYQVDKKNGVGKIFNWNALSHLEDETPTTTILYEPKLQVTGEDKGIRHTFSITEDQFSDGDRRLVNHRKYYFTAVAYAYNNYKDFEPETTGDQGQQNPYLEGRRNIGDDKNPFYTIIPRKTLDRQLQSTTGDTPIITRIDGVGTGTNFLDISTETRAEIEQAILEDDPSLFSNKITYKNGMAPIDVSIFNPLDVVNGEYELTFTDNNMDNDDLDSPTFWTLRNLTNPNAPIITSDTPISDINEQIINEYGFSITVAQVNEPGSMPFEDETNGAIGYIEEYLNPDATPWLYGMVDNQTIETGNPQLDAVIFDYIATSEADMDFNEDPNQSLSTMSSGTGVFVPYYLCNWRSKPNDVPYLSPAWMNSGNQNHIVHGRTSLATLNNIDIVFTSNKDLWSRCVVVETANPAHKDIIAATPENDYIEGDADMFDLRKHVSASKEAGPDGWPLPDLNAPEGEETGMGWFPGYAIDVETGLRLNIFFGENSAYNGHITGASSVGADMMFNPSSEIYFNSPAGSDETLLNFPMGGQHFIYVTNQPYDRCAQQRIRFGASSEIQKIAPLEDVTWAGLVVLPQGAQMNSYADGLIPDDLTVKIRVNNSYQVEVGTGEFDGYPTYRFKLEGMEATALDDVAIDAALQSIHAVPNPYYGFSDYESSQFESVVKISNLPAVCTISIYSLEGVFIRTYERNELGVPSNSPNRSIEQSQITPDIEWNLKNFKGIPISSGVYLIHLSAPGLGERTLKWFGVNRQADMSGL